MDCEERDSSWSFSTGEREELATSIGVFICRLEEKEEEESLEEGGRSPREEDTIGGGCGRGGEEEGALKGECSSTVRGEEEGVPKGGRSCHRPREEEEEEEEEGEEEEEERRVLPRAGALATVRGRWKRKGGGMLSDHLFKMKIIELPSENPFREWTVLEKKSRHDQVLRFHTYYGYLYGRCDYPKRYPPLQDLVDNYIIYTGKEDHVVCVFCGLVMGEWNRGDDVFKAHKRGSPQCRVVHWREDKKGKDVSTAYCVDKKDVSTVCPEPTTEENAPAGFMFLCSLL